MLICIATGISSGLPLYVLISLVPAWLKSENVGLKEIGLFALIGFPYSWKFIWSPIMDRYTLPWLGRRRGWMLITQCVLMFLIGTLGWIPPASSLSLVAILTILIAFFSASQDIVIDAYRREILTDTQLGLGNSIHVNAYRLSGLVPGSLALIVADYTSWQLTFFITSLFMLCGLVMTVCVKEVPVSYKPITLKASITAPFSEFFQRQGVKKAIAILAFMFFYKLGDNMATALATPFYLDIGFTKTQIGLVAKNAALWPMVFGGLLGGLIMVKIGINRALWVFGFVQLISILGFAWLATAGNVLWILAVVIGCEYLGVGLGTAAFIAFIAQITNKAFAATQLALFTALTAVPRTFANASTGFLVEAVGWTQFFFLCAAFAVPGMLLLFKVAPWIESETDKA